MGHTSRPVSRDRILLLSIIARFKQSSRPGARVNTIARLSRCLSIFVLSTASGAACLAPAEKQPGGFVPRGIAISTRFARELALFYAPIPPNDLERLQRRVATICDIRKAAEGLHYNSVQFYQGKFGPGERRGTFCVWNRERELIEFAQYDPQGRLAGVHATFYREKLRSVSAWAPAKREQIVTRAWDWVLNNRQWVVTLAFVKFYTPRDQRTIEYIFERETGFLIKRLEYIETPRGRVHRGIHYNGYPSKEYPQCVDFLPDGRRRMITDRCEFEDEIIPGSNRF